MRKKLDYEYCSASPILEWLGDKWALVVLLKLHENGVIRFNELYKTIPSISEKMLSTVLRSLVTDGLVSRKICGNEHCASVPRRKWKKHAHLAGYDVKKTDRTGSRLE